MNDVNKILEEIFSLKDKAPNLSEKENSERKCKIQNSIKGNLNEKDGYNCPVCLNRGIWFKPRKGAHGYEEVGVVCECMKKRKSLAAIQNSGLSDTINKYDFESFETSAPWQKYIFDKAREFAKNPESWFFLGGTTGCGKTHLCTAICKNLIKNGHEVKYMMWREESVKLKSIVNDISYEDEICKYKDIEVLYIDDMFKSGCVPTSADINLAFEILNNRYARGKITIVSSECTLNDLYDIDEAIAGRIKQMSKDYCMSIEKDSSKNYRMR